MRPFPQKIISCLLSIFILFSCLPIINVGADSVIEIFNDDGIQITEKQYLTEYRTQQLQAGVPVAADDGSISGASVDTSTGNYVVWSSNLPLLANVDDTGKVTAYDFSKKAIIQLWIDENIRSLPLIGDSTADAIWSAFESSGIDLDSASTDTIVGIVTAIAGETLGNSLRTYLDNMNVVVTATLYDASGKALGSDSVEFVIEKSLIASVAPTGVHITNKKTVPTTVAVGSTVQLYGACTPVRLNQGIAWYVGDNMFEYDSQNYATVSSTGLVTFTAPGTATIRVNPENKLYGTFVDKITFTIVDRESLPVESFDIAGETSVGEGETIQLSVKNVIPAGAYQGDLTWSSADPTIAIVDETGVVTGLNGGDGLTYSKTVVITATMGGVSKNIEIKVTRPLVAALSGITIEGDTVLGIGATASYTSTVAPSRLNTSSSVSREWGVFDDDTGTVIYATSGAPATNGIVNVDASGNVTAVSAGVARLYAKATYGSSVVEAYTEITCGNAITDFVITGTTSIDEGETAQLSINVLSPDNYEVSLLNTVKWRVDNASVASVSSNGLVLGRDAGGRNSSKTTTVYATISGVTRSATITVSRGWLNLSKFTDGEVVGSDYVIRDIPHGFSMKTYPESLSQSATYWAIATDNGSAPWSVSNTYSGGNRNTENEYASISDDGMVTGKKTGTTTVYGFARYLLQTHVERTKQIDIIEILPESITIKAPDKTEYVEGETELDLTGMEVYLNYNKEALAPYYSDWESYTDAQLTCKVTDYEVSELNQKIIDSQQYIIVSVERAGKTYNAVFTVTLNSKQVSSIVVTSLPDKTVYVEGEQFDSTGLTVAANYLNANSETVTDYTIDYTSFSMETYGVRQNVRVVYEHAGRMAETTFSIIVYGKPVISVSVNGVIGEWTTEDISFTFDSTHQLSGATYYYRLNDDYVWYRISGNTLKITSDTNAIYHFKAVNSLSFESDESEAFAVMLDKTTPSFTLNPSVTYITNQDYNVNFDNLSYSVSGIASVTVNGIEIDKESVCFTVTRNDSYTVKITANNGLSSEQSIEINNIDKEVPGVTGVVLIQDPQDAPERHLDGELGNYYSADLLAVATAEDSGVAGVDYIKYRLVMPDYSPVTDWIVLTEEAAICNSNFKGYFEFVAVDRAGNESSSYYSNGFVRDSAKPVITTLNATCGEDGEEYVPGEWADDIVYFTPQADSFSGVYEYYYNINGGEWVKLTTETLRARDDGTFVYGFKAISYSGLESDVYQINVNVDRTVPTIRVELNGTIGQWTKDNVTFTLSTLIECASGCTYYYSDGTGWHRLVGNSLVLDESTNAYYSFKAINGAGLESAPSDSYKVMIDNVEPSGYIIPGVTEKTDAPYDVAIVPVAGESGYLKIYFNGQDVTQELKATVSKNGSYALTIIGNNMLSSTVMIDITNFAVIPTSLFSYEQIDANTLKLLSYNGSGANVTVPMEIDGHETKLLSANAFANKASVASVNIPNTVETIEDSCFKGCENLSKIIIPQSVTVISANAFIGCNKLTIYCYDGSYAHLYAQENNIPFVLIDIVPVGKTIINEQAGIIFTQQTAKTMVEEIVKADSSYMVMAIPSVTAPSTNYYGTGSVFYFFRNGTLVYTYNVVVYGDVNGDSVVDALDAASTQLASRGLNTVQGNYLLAIDFANDGAVDALDYQSVINLSLR